MSARPERKKMCWNCEGNVSLIAENCPYCQAALYPQEEEAETPVKQEFPSPYKLPRADRSTGKLVTPTSPFAENFAEKSSEEEDGEEDHSAEKGDATSIEHLNEAKHVVVTMSMLMGGLVFFLFALLLLMFSSNGYLVLRWSSAYWYFYAAIGALMLFLGFYNLKNVDENE